MDPELQNWQSSLSAQQLSEHTAKPHTDFSKAFGDTKYMGNDGQFKQVHRGTRDEYLEDEDVEMNPDNPESIKYLGQHWTDDSSVARNFATRDDYTWSPAKTGRVFSGLAHSTDIWDPEEEGAEDHFGQYAIWHPNDDDDYNDDGFGEQEKTIKSDRPVVIKNIRTYKATHRPGGRRSPDYSSTDEEMKPGTVGRTGSF